MPDARRKPILPMSPERISKFWENIKIGQVEECWPWNAGKDTLGYGVFQVHSTKGWIPSDGKRSIQCIRSHRIAFALINGYDPEGLICHKCDNTSCCNPGHLFEGTDQDNVLDMWTKNKANNVHQKLTEAQVREIMELYPVNRPRSRGRERYKDPTPQYGETAKKYGVHWSTIERIANRRNWCHINKLECMTL